MWHVSIKRSNHEFDNPELLPLFQNWKLERNQRIPSPVSTRGRRAGGEGESVAWLAERFGIPAASMGEDQDGAVKAVKQVGSKLEMWPYFPIGINTALSSASECHRG